MTSRYRTLTLVTFLFAYNTITTNLFAQTQFFKSQQQFSAAHLESSYSSVSVSGDNLLFLANDYTLYCYNSLTGKEKWNYYLGYKTTRPCFIAAGSVYAPYQYDDVENTIRIDLATGKLINMLPIGPLETRPVLRNNILYGTALHSGGTVFAYDTKQDSLLWWKFVAHGVSTQPYFFNDYIHANAEFDNWFTIHYNGRLRDTVCAEEAQIFVEDIRCIRKFSALSHDGLELTESFSEKVFGEDRAITPENTYHTTGYTVIQYEDELAILGNKRKLIKKLEVPGLLTGDARTRENGLTRFIRTENNRVYLLCRDVLLRYDLVKLKVDQVTDLSAWQPQAIELDKDKIWLISRKDGLLYGLAN